MYLTYEEYVSMGGSLNESAFCDYDFEAEALINYVTFNRLRKDTEYPVEVKRLVKYLIDMVQRRANALSLGGNADGSVTESTANITSQSNDGVSVSYNGMAATDLFTLCKDESEKAIKRFLYGVVNEAGRYLLYRGLYPGE